MDTKTDTKLTDGQSDGEAAFAYYLRTEGHDLPPCTPQYPIPEGNRHGSKSGLPIRADFAWPDRRIILEIQGKGHNEWSCYQADLIRHNMLTMWGYRVLYVTPEQLKQNPRKIIGILRKMLIQGKYQR